MSDVVDIAQERIELALQDKLDRRVRFEGVSATHCDECGTSIPSARHKALPGVRLCVACKSIEERR